MNDMVQNTANILSRPLNLRRAAGLVWKSAPVWTAAGAVLVVIQGLLPLAALYVTRMIVDGVAAGVASPVKIESFRHVLVWIAAAVVLALLSILCRALADLVEEGQSLAVTDAVSDRLHAQSIAVDLAYYEDPRYFDTLHQAQAEAPYRPTRIVNALVMLCQNGLSLAGVVLLLFSYNWWLALILFLVAVPGLLVRVAFSRRFYGLKQGQVEEERRAWYYADILTTAAYAKELRLFDLGGLFQNKFLMLRRDLRRNLLAMSRRRAGWEFLAQAAATTAVLAPFAFIAYQAIDGAITLGALVMYYQGFQAGLGFIQSFFQGLAGLYEDSLFLDNYYRFLDLTPSIAPPPLPKPVPRAGDGGIVFRNVHFTYPGGGTKALDGVSLSIAPGQVIALVGGNGSGKTTLVKLLCRLYDPDAGSVEVAGVDLRQLDPGEWRREISVIFQDYIRYHMTALENIWLGNAAANPDQDRIVAAACAAGADGVIRGLPRGYENMLGRMFSDGRELSFGEWQKVALARAFMRESRVVVLDEPASSLDPVAEEELFSRFRRLVEGRSAVLISHRMSAAQVADYIYVLDGGRLCEQGTHRDLLDKGGVYARLFKAQSAGLSM